jgi:hypothetical protein
VEAEAELYRNVETIVDQFDFVTGVLDTVRIHFSRNDRPYLRYTIRDAGVVYRWYPAGVQLIPVHEVPYQLEGQVVTLLVSTGHGKHGNLAWYEDLFSVDESIPA